MEIAIAFDDWCGRDFGKREKFYPTKGYEGHSSGSTTATKATYQITKL
jgi:hypothetical protein